MAILVPSAATALFPNFAGQPADDQFDLSASGSNSAFFEAVEWNQVQSEILKVQQLLNTQLEPAGTWKIKLADNAGAFKFQITDSDDAVVYEVDSNGKVTIQADMDANNNKIINLTTPTVASDAANKAYVDSVAQGLDHKEPVATSTEGLGNITLSGEQTLNGVTTSTSRVGVIEQTLGEENGIYDTAAGAWTRAVDADENSEVTNGMTFWVEDATSTVFRHQYLLTTPNPIVIGTTPLTFSVILDLQFGTTAGTATEGNDSRVPVQDENDALVGTNGTPSAANKYVTNSDPRNSDSRTPTGPAGGGLGGTYPNPTVTVSDDITLDPGKSLYQEVYPSDEDSVLNLSLRDTFDRSPFGNDVVLEGAAVISGVAGRIGSGLRLDGTGGTLGRVADNASLQFTDLLTAEAWIFPNTDGAAFHPIVSKTDSGIGNGWNFTYQSNGLRVTFRKNNGAGVSDTNSTGIIASGQVPTSVYTHVAMTYDDSTNALKVYINGILVDSRTFVATTGVGDGWDDSADDLIIGNRLKDGLPQGTNEFDGDMSNVRVYNRILADEEIRIHYLRGVNYQTQGASVADKWRVLDTSGAPWMDFDKDSRKPLTHDPTEVFDIYAPSDLGTAILAPDGVMRVPLVAGARYIFHKNMTLPRLLMPKVVSPGTFELVTFSGGRIVALLFDGDDTPHIWGREVGGWFANNLQFIDISNSGAGRGTVLFDMVGGNAEFSAFSTFTVAHANFKQLGRLVDMGLFQGHISQDAGNASGFTVRVTPANAAEGQSSSISLKRFLGSLAVADNKHPAYTFIGDNPEVVMIGNGIDLGKAANSFLHIDSGTTEGNYNIIGNAYLSVTESGEFFRPDLITSITEQANADIAITSFSDAGGGKTNVNFGAIQDFTRGQVILIADETAYDGTHTIVSVADDQQSFVINVAFSTSGPGTLKMVKHTVAVNKYTRDETVTVSDTSNDGTHQILREDDTSFHLPQEFATGDFIGTATSIGKTCQTVGVNCAHNGAEEESKSIGSVVAVGNSTVTTITVINTWTDFAFGTSAVAGENIERWTVTNAATGEIRYDGNKPFSGSFAGTFVGFPPGSQNYEFRVVKNGSPLTGNPIIATGFTSARGTVPVFFPITAVNGDLFRMQVQNTDGTDNITFEHLSVAAME